MYLAFDLQENFFVDTSLLSTTGQLISGAHRVVLTDRPRSRVREFMKDRRRMADRKCQKHRSI